MCITRTFEAIHLDLDRLIYVKCSPLQMVAQEIFFFDAACVVPRRDVWGNLVPIHAQNLTNMEWGLPENSTLMAFKRQTGTNV